MRNKKVFKLFMVISLVFILILTSNFLACVPPEEEPGPPEIVAAIPLAVQFWEPIEEVLVDIIVLSDEYTEEVVIARQWATLPEPIELNDLTWDETDEIVHELTQGWMGWDEEPVLLEPGGELTLEIPTDVGDAAVVVRYTVALATNPDAVVVHFISEATIDPDVPGTIEDELWNFDVHNDTGGEVDNLELEIDGDVTAEDVTVWYEGYYSWGLPAEITTVVGVGVEIMWKDTDNPLQHCDTKHFGLLFDSDVDLQEVRAYWTRSS